MNAGMMRWTAGNLVLERFFTVNRFTLHLNRTLSFERFFTANRVTLRLNRSRPAA